MATIPVDPIVTQPSQPTSGASNITDSTDSTTGAFRVTATLTFPDGTIGYLDRTFTAYQYQVFLAFCNKYLLTSVQIDQTQGWTSGDVARMIADLHIPLSWAGPAPTPPTPPTPISVPSISN